MIKLNLELIEKRLVNGVETAVENDHILDYERNTFLSKLINIIVVFFLRLMPSKLGGFLIDKSSKKTRLVKSKATTYSALDALYTNRKLCFDEGILKGFINYFWFKLGNARAVRNRLKLVKKILTEIIINNIGENFEKVRIFSLGCGSSRAVLGTVSNVKKLGLGQDMFDIWLLDKDREALDYSELLIKEYKLSKYSFNFILNKVRNFDKYIKGASPNIIEMIGVLDYLDENDAKEFFKKIYNNLDNDGFFITANIRKNREAFFVSNAIKWRMIYREPEDLIKILLTAGFKKSKIKIVSEPLKIHMVAICQK
ncbi:MAG: hypothetical protein ABIC36_00075 [bacterium]